MFALKPFARGGLRLSCHPALLLMIRNAGAADEENRLANSPELVTLQVIMARSF
jgi:hypothetical protein